MNNCTFLIRLVADPDLKFIPGSGMAVASFTGAVDKGLSREKRTELEAQGKKTADFPRFKAFGKTAENISLYFSKGSLMLVESRVQTDSYKNDKGDTVYTTDFIVDKFHFVGEKKSDKKVVVEDDDFSFGANAFEAMGDDDDCLF
jgi:single-strand DNA-binding protein